MIDATFVSWASGTICIKNLKKGVLHGRNIKWFIYHYDMLTVRWRESESFLLSKLFERILLDEPKQFIHLVSSSFKGSHGMCKGSYDKSQVLDRMLRFLKYLFLAPQVWHLRIRPPFPGEELDGAIKYVLDINALPQALTSLLYAFSVFFKSIPWVLTVWKF